MTDNNNIRKFPSKKPNVEQIPAECQNTEGYWLNEVLFTNQQMKVVPDLTRGGKRNRRWGFALAMTAVPQYDEVPPNGGPTLLPKTPTRFFTADSVEELRARLIYEVNKVVDMMKLSVDNPDEYMRIHKEAMEALDAQESALQPAEEDMC